MSDSNGIHGVMVPSRNVDVGDMAIVVKKLLRHNLS
jgi:hypothetical protein